MKNFMVKKKKFRLLCCLIAVLALWGIPFVVQAEEIVQVYELKHKHVAACEVTGYETRSATSSSGPSITETNTCDDCGATHHKYRFTASCTCGKTWSRTGHACVNSPYGKNQGSCSNYSKVNTDTSHSHPVKQYGCGMTDESVIGKVSVYKDTLLPAQSVTMRAEAEGDLENINIAWADSAEGNILTVEENGVYSLYIAYTENGIDYMHNTEVSVDNIDKEPPNVSDISADNTDYTSGDIVLSVSAEDAMGLPENCVSWNGGEYGADYTFTVSENGVYDVAVKDMAGNTVVRSIEISNIDKHSPEITGISKAPSPWYSGKLILTVEAKDIGNGNEGCGLAEEAYSFDGGNTWTNQPYYEVDTPQKVFICVRDAVGNTASKEVELAYDKKPVKDKTPSEHDDDKRPVSENSEPVPSEEEPISEESEVLNEPKTTIDDSTVDEEDESEEDDASELISDVPSTTIDTVIIESEELLTEKTPELKEVKEVEKTENAKVTVVVVSASLGVFGLVALFFIAYIFLLMCKVYEADNEGKEKYIGSVKVTLRKNGLAVKIKDRYLMKTKSRNLKLRLPGILVKRYRHKPISITAGKSVIEKYVEEKIGFSFRL